MRIHYTKDQNGQEILCDESGQYQVMMEWEKDYMEKCIQTLNPRGSVLEIGFGMGYSAEAIVKNPGVLEYTVIECSPEVWKRFEKFKENFGKNIKINLVKGRWQDVLYTLGKFDYCFFDDFSYEGTRNRFVDFLYEFMKEHADLGAKFGCYSNGKIVMEDVKYLIFDNYDYNYDGQIPEHCRYTTGVFMPIITKISNDVHRLPLGRPRLFNNPNTPIPRGVSVFESFHPKIKIYKNFKKDSENFHEKIFGFCGQNIRECMLTSGFDYRGSKTLGILFSDREQSDTCTITLDGSVTLKNTYNTLVVFKDCSITHTIERAIKVYLLYL